MAQRTEKAINPGIHAERVMIIKLSALGDFVLALGAMKAIRRFHPAARITLLTTSPFETFAEKCPYVDIVETDGRPQGMSGANALVNRIRKQKYDIVYDLQTSDRTANYFRAMKLPGRKPPLWSGHVDGCAFPHTNPARAKMHTIDRLGDQLTDAGLPPEADWPPMPDFSWVLPALGHSPRLDPAYFGLTSPYALIIPGASAHRTEKVWPVENYVEIARKIADHGIIPALIGGKSEGEITATIARAEPRAKNLATRTDLFQLAALGAKAQFSIGNDTGPMHMVTLAGSPGVALFATTQSDPDHAAPRGSSVIVVHGPTLGDVAPSDVWQALNALGVLAKHSFLEDNRK